MIRLTLPIPPSINKTSRAGINQKSGKVYKPGARLKGEFEEWVKLAAIAAGVAGKGMQGPLGLIIHWYFPNHRVLDNDNGVKLLQDSLAQAIGFNDRQICETHVYRIVEKGIKPHCEIELRELE